MSEDKSQWPDWLRDADTSGAVVKIMPGGTVVWLGGEWHGGEWLGGEWLGGVWLGGEWRGGDWCGGEWHGGAWHGGVDNPTRTPFRVRGSGDTIRVGCWSGTIAEAKRLLAGGTLPVSAPDRESPDGKLLRRAVLAQIAWQEAAE